MDSATLTTPLRSKLCTQKECPWAQAKCSGVDPRASLAAMLMPLLARACKQPSCPRMAAMWAGVHPLGVITVASAPCHSNQWRHCTQGQSRYTSSCTLNRQEHWHRTCVCSTHPSHHPSSLPSSNQIQQKMLYFKTERYLKYVESSGHPSPTPTLSRSCLKFEKLTEFWNAETCSKFWQIQKYSVSAGLIRNWVIAVLSYPHLKVFLVLAVNLFGRVPQGGRVVYGLSLSTFWNLTDGNSPTHQKKKKKKMSFHTCGVLVWLDICHWTNSRGLVAKVSTAWAWASETGRGGLWRGPQSTTVWVTVPDLKSWITPHMLIIYCLRHGKDFIKEMPRSPLNCAA